VSTSSEAGGGGLDAEPSAVMNERRRLVNLAYRLLGSLAEAKDAVQEAYTRWYEWAAAGPAGIGADPADRVTLDESVGMAFLVVLESMTPAERVAFVLHDVFRYPFAEVAGITGRTPAACRQLASWTREPRRSRTAAAWSRRCRIPSKARSRSRGSWPIWSGGHRPA